MMTETVVNVEGAPNNNAANKPSSGGQLSWLRINIEYFKTAPGLVKIAQIVSRKFFWKFLGGPINRSCNACIGATLTCNLR